MALPAKGNICVTVGGGRCACQWVLVAAAQKPLLIWVLNIVMAGTEAPPGTSQKRVWKGIFRALLWDAPSTDPDIEDLEFISSRLVAGWFASS